MTGATINKIALGVAFSVVWAIGYAGGWSSGIKPQIDLAAAKSCYNLEHNHHVHQ